jgi:hypothetical protein
VPAHAAVLNYGGMVPPEQYGQWYRHQQDLGSYDVDPDSDADDEAGLGRRPGYTHGRSEGPSSGGPGSRRRRGWMSGRKRREGCTRQGVKVRWGLPKHGPRGFELWPGPETMRDGRVKRRLLYAAVSAAILACTLIVCEFEQASFLAGNGLRTAKLTRACFFSLYSHGARTQSRLAGLAVPHHPHPLHPRRRRLLPAHAHPAAAHHAPRAKRVLHIPLPPAPRAVTTRQQRLRTAHCAHSRSADARCRIGG